MNLKMIAATSATVLALGAGSAFAWEMEPHDTLSPSQGSASVTTQSYADGADLQLPGTGSVSSGSAVYDYQCANAKAANPAGSFVITTFCAPGDR